MEVQPSYIHLGLVNLVANQSRSGTILSALVVQTCWEICSVKLTKHVTQTSGKVVYE